MTGYIDLGYRWQTGVGGSLDTYRSIVNLGAGPKVLGADFSLTTGVRPAWIALTIPIAITVLGLLRALQPGRAKLRPRPS